MAEPSIVQTGQYLKDLSFENYAASAAAAGAPGMELNMNVEVKPLTQPAVRAGAVSGDYEVTLQLRATARPGAEADENARPLFVVEIAYAGRYQMGNIPEDQVEPFLAIEAPRLLFPFVRQIAADAVMQGGLPPLLLAPMDFAQIYQQNRTGN